ncbi:MAG: leucyl aminopeptidase [Candidatus Anstonellales archaeon]
MDHVKKISLKGIENPNLEIALTVEEEKKEANKLYFSGKNLEFILPKSFEDDNDILRKAAATILEYLISNNVKRANLNLTILKNSTQSKAFLEGLLISSYFFSMKSKSSESNIEIGLINSKLNEKELDELKDIFYYVNLTRDLVNSPANVMTIDNFINKIKEEAKKFDTIKINIIDSEELQKLGMNQILAVGQGSVNKPKLLIMEYSPAEKFSSNNEKDKQVKKKTIEEFDLALIGKGVIFDSGGLSLKPAKSMETMKEDMAGAATVMAILLALAKLGINKKAIALAPLVENMPSGSATKPGDVIKSYSGKTVEILNTDAEGRLILGDTIAYAYKNYKFKKLIDFATLTGACLIALGPFAAAILGNDKELIKDLFEIGNELGEKLWELPTWPEYSELIKSKIADIKNIGNDGLGAGTIVGAIFLKEFVNQNNWAHIDIASTAFHEQKIKYYQPGATGFGVRLVVEFAKKKL